MIRVLHRRRSRRRARGPARLPRPAGGHAPALPLRPERLRLRELVLLGGRPGRQPVLEGLLLRLAGRRQRHHRRQAPGLAVADGAVGADLRPELLGDPRARGADGRRHGRRGVRLRAPPVQPRGRADRGRRARADPGRRADVPVQQPGRDAGPADGRGLLLRGPRAWRTAGRSGWCGPGSRSASRSSPRPFRPS